jgi:adenylosuccinate lyase
MTRVIDGLEIDLDAVKRNLQVSNEAILSEYILTQLTKAGMERPKAHNILRDLSAKAREQKTTLLDLAKTDTKTRETLEGAEISVETYFDSIRETSKIIVERTIRKYNDSLSATE